MYRRRILLLATFAFALFLTIALAPQANASPNLQTGSFQSFYYNYYDAGGLNCPANPLYSSSDTEIWKYWPENTSPVPGTINTTNYMVCWAGNVYFPAAGTYTVYTLNDDGMNVWVNGAIAMNAWYNQGPTWHQGNFTIPAPGYYPFNVKYYNAPNAGVACVSWALQGQPYTWKCPYPPAPPQPTPVPICPGCQPIYPTPPPCPYYPNCIQPLPPCYPYPQCAQPQPPPPPVVTCWYRIRYGDTLYGIAWKFGVTTWQLQQWNNIPNPNYIYAGMTIRVCGY